MWSAPLSTSTGSRAATVSDGTSAEPSGGPASHYGLEVARRLTIENEAERVAHMIGARSGVGS
jgi:hypothetical protein